MSNANFGNLYGKLSVLPYYQHKGGIPTVLLEEKTTLLFL
jgi:hypothetical protein